MHDSYLRDIKDSLQSLRIRQRHHNQASWKSSCNQVRRVRLLPVLHQPPKEEGG